MTTFEENLQEYFDLREADARGDFLPIEDIRRFWELGQIPGLRATAYRILMAEADAAEAAVEEEEWAAAIELAAKADGETIKCTCENYPECQECYERAARDFDYDPSP